MLYKQLVAAAFCGAAAIDSALASPFDGGRLLSKREVPSTHIRHERQMPHWARTWEKKQKVKKSAVLPMRIGLRQAEAKLQEGRDLLMERSNPLSPYYGQRMTPREVIDFFAPPKESVEVVRDWLVASGINVTRISQSVNKQWIQFDATTAEVENLLVTDYYYWEHSPTGSENIAAEEYHIPAHVQTHIDYITPGIRLRADPGRVRSLKRRAEAEQFGKRAVKAMNTGIDVIGPDASSLPPLNSSVCDSYVTQECIRTQYSIPKGDKAAEGNELGVFESLGDHYAQNDLDVYWSTLYSEIPNGTYPIEKGIDGAYGAAKTLEAAGVESDLDFEAAQPLIWPQRTILFQTDDEYYQQNETAQDTPLKGFWNTFYDALDGSYCTYSAYGETGNCVLPECLDPAYPDPNPGGYTGQLQCGVYEPTNVISISYGGGESDVPSYYTKRQCDEIMKLGLQGTTVVISSGDDGVGSFEGDGGPNGCAGPEGKVFYPASDATCPYVLAVGSLQLDKVSGNSSTPKYVESATARFPSGGGFSNYFDTPDYQKDQVATYFDTVTLNFTGYTDPGTNFSTVGDGVYKIGGRGYPDVSAIGDDYVVRAQGSWGRVGGTSLSAPIWAAVLTRVNEERIAAGKSTLGFVNPTLYAHPEVFTDVTNGSNPNCHSTGFLAAPGWDPVTGLGSPVYPKLLDLLLSV
ncbi:hypothetical protein J7T55_014175 [Diaporthe amygdali]|uniref:uncharacterized protein n=1 Tax=Phomopsis amygdali TaxID=1214568 RepID=UPI0022FE98B0|nr:uncharacterized protein J7T55_014175 [Diaporthe amygdali]KAJ0109613.1 hypothetical protein J7T55_014175 [Diaporthe amygdali]